MSEARAQPLGAIDRFQLRMHREGAAAKMGASACAIVAELEGRADIDRLRARLDALVGALEGLRWRLGRAAFAGGLLSPVWRAADEARGLRVVDVRAPLMDVANARLGLDISERAPWQLEVWRGAENDSLALRWFHPLIDALGAARLLAALGDVESDDLSPEGRFAAPEARLAKLPFRERLALMRRYGQHALEVAQQGAIVSPRRARGDGDPGRSQALRLRFTADETARFVKSLRERARLADTSLLLRAAARLHRRLLAEGGIGTPRHVVPVPLSLDPKREARRLFGNQVTMMMLGLDDAMLEDEGAVVASLAEQRRAIVRGKLDLGLIASLQMLRSAPEAASQWLAKSPFDGQRCSFILSNPGALTFDRLAGSPVRDAFSLLTAAPDPGLVVVGQRFGDAMSVLFAWCDGYLEREQIEAHLSGFRADLLG